MKTKNIVAHALWATACTVAVACVSYLASSFGLGALGPSVAACSMLTVVLLGLGRNHPADADALQEKASLGINFATGLSVALIALGRHTDLPIVGVCGIVVAVSYCVLALARDLDEYVPLWAVLLINSTQAMLVARQLF